jgi:hypothetical protein
MSKRKIADEEDARACLDRAKVAGQSPGEWARSNGVDGRSLNIWRVNLERAGPRRRVGSSVANDLPRIGLVELVPRAERVESGSGARYVLEIEGTRLEFGDDASSATLRRVLEAVRAC